jgi:hypothetical protein
MQEYWGEIFKKDLFDYNALDFSSSETGNFKTRPINFFSFSDKTFNLTKFNTLNSFTIQDLSLSITSFFSKNESYKIFNDTNLEALNLNTINARYFNINDSSEEFDLYTDYSNEGPN